MPTPSREQNVAHPSGDKRFKILDGTIRRHHRDPDSLIEVLHKAQELFGFLEEDVLWYISRALDVPPSRVYGVATFYHLFTLKPQGKHTCVVCMGTACYVKGADAILAQIEKDYGVKAGETTPDKSLSVVQARCLGACGIAPAVVFDGGVAGRLTVDQVMQRLDEWAEKDHAGGRP